MIDNRAFDRHGNLFVALVRWDFDHGWMCEEWNDGEYESTPGAYGDCDECRKAAVSEGLRIAKDKGGRVHHCYESPEEITAKLRDYPRDDSDARFMCECPCCDSGGI